jgi:hypothetical protein
LANLAIRKNSKEITYNKEEDKTKDLSFGEFHRLIAEVQRMKENLSSNQ